jgi:GNAT superfamily N-acetyltransferase
MTLESFRIEDIASFLALAEAEKWVAESWEFEFLLSEFPQGCFVARGDNGETTGFVTSLRHENSGWIGNLIVSPAYRRCGIGEKLFTGALEALQEHSAETIWLTASKAGAPLYEKQGFSSVDTVVRWVGTGSQRPVEPLGTTGQGSLASTSLNLDILAWGDRRASLLDVTTRRGTLFQHDSGLLIRQPCGNAVQFGPFSAEDGGSAERLFDEASGNVSFGMKFLVDAPASNREALRLFNRKKMRIAGSTQLMYAGKKPAYRPELIYGLATMGSCG